MAALTAAFIEVVALGIFVLAIEHSDYLGSHLLLLFHFPAVLIPAFTSDGLEPMTYLWIATVAIIQFSCWFAICVLVIWLRRTRASLKKTKALL